MSSAGAAELLKYSGVYGLVDQAKAHSCHSAGHNGCTVPTNDGRRRHRTGRLLFPPILLSLVCHTGGVVLTSAPQTLHWPAWLDIHHIFVVIVCLGLGFLFGSFAESCSRRQVSLLARPAALNLLCVIVYITGDVGVFIANDLAGEGYNREAAMFCSAVISMLVGLGASSLEGGLTGLQDAMDFRHWARSMPVAICFSLSLWCQMQAVSRLSGVLVKMLFQLKLPCTVLMSTLLLRQTYSFLQLSALFEIFLAVIIFTHLEVEPLFAHGVQQIDWRAGTAMLGLAYSFASVLLNVLGSLLSERFFKEGTSVSMYAKVAHIKAGELVVTSVMMCCHPGMALHISGPSAILASFNMRSWRVVGFLVLDSWMSVIVVKQLSSVVKALAKCVSVVLLFILAVAVFKTKSFQLMQFIAAMLVVNGSILYTFASHSMGQQRANHASQQQADHESEDPENGPLEGKLDKRKWNQQRRKCNGGKKERLEELEGKLEENVMKLGGKLEDSSKPTGRNPNETL